ncbi:cell wall protein [Streptomyces sp. NPDC007088]|uniref:cell wall protein n=1 Tax=Streptomyces sp. NPDC007088 TaxID=3364773 RepID=UPI00369E375D
MPHDASPSPFPEDRSPRDRFPDVASSRRSAPGKPEPGTARRPLTWPRALGHGVASGTVLFLLLVLSMTLFPDGRLFALIFLGGLVVPPALAAHHYGRGNPALTRGKQARTVRPEVLDYAREVQALDYRPGPDSTEDDLADYQLALDAYEKALDERDDEDAAVTLQEGWTALARLRVPNAEWNHGTGQATLRLVRPEPGRPAVLAFTSPALGLVRLRTRGPRGSWIRLYEAGGPVCARLPLPAREGATLQLEIHTEGAWRTAVLGASVIRALDDETPAVHGHGGDLLHVAPTPRLLFRHSGQGPYQVRHLMQGLRPAGVVAEGSGPAQLWLPHTTRTALLQIQTRGGWSLSSRPKES